MPPTNRRRTTNKMRNARGMQLVEMVVALGLSGVFIVLLSQMMSENMRLGTATATDQMATAALDSLEENMLNMPYGRVVAQPASEQIPIVFENPDDASFLLTSQIRKIPLQQDLTNATTIWGGFNPFNKQIDTANRWQKGKGTYLKGFLYKTISQVTVGEISTAKVTLTLKYSSDQIAKLRTRIFYVIDNDSSPLNPNS